MNYTAYTKYIMPLVLIICMQTLFAQDSFRMTGRVTYTTSQNIYAEFSSTEGIAAGDTLFIILKGKYIPAVLVKFVSSRSTAGPAIDGHVLKKDDTLFAFVSPPAENRETTEIVTEPPAKPTAAQDTSGSIVSGEPKSSIPQAASIKGRASVQSSSSFVNGGTEDDLQRWRYTLAVEGQNTGITGLSFRTYMNFAYNTRDWAQIKDAPLNRVQFYDINVSYTPDSLSRLTGGRYINPRTANIGAVDGVQYERSFSEWNAGIFAGSRPSPINYGFDAKLFQSGVYINRQDTLAAGIMENTIAAALLTNNFVTDRRFIYLQHSSYLLPTVNLFVSSEADFYKNISGTSTASPELSSLYISLRSRIASGLNALVSYDARRNVMYYETYKNFIDSLFSNELRQGARASVSYRAGRGLMLNFSGGYRFKKGDSKSSANYSGFISYYGVPYISGSASYNFTQLSSSYANAVNHTITYRNDIAGGVSYSAGYRYLKYNYSGRASASTQNIVFGDMNWNFSGKSYLTLSVEEAFIGKMAAGRVYIDITTRF